MASHWFVFWMDVLRTFAIGAADLQNDLDRRKAGHFALTTQRKEADEVKILIRACI